MRRRVPRWRSPGQRSWAPRGGWRLRSRHYAWAPRAPTGTSPEWRPPAPGRGRDQRCRSSCAIAWRAVVLKRLGQDPGTAVVMGDRSPWPRSSRGLSTLCPTAPLRHRGPAPWTKRGQPRQPQCHRSGGDQFKCRTGSSCRKGAVSDGARHRQNIALFLPGRSLARASAADEPAFPIADSRRRPSTVPAAGRSAAPGSGRRVRTTP